MTEVAPKMTIPALNAEGFLPPGLHTCTLADIRERFGQFQSTDTRPTLFARLENLMQEIKSASLFSELIVDGSFVTSKPDPGDIDLVLVLSDDHDPSVELPPYQANLLSATFIKRRWKFDAFVVPAQSEAKQKYVEFFQQVKGTAATKGVLRVLP